MKRWMVALPVLLFLILGVVIYAEEIYPGDIYSLPGGEQQNSGVTGPVTGNVSETDNMTTEIPVLPTQIRRFWKSSAWEHKNPYMNMKEDACTRQYNYILQENMYQIGNVDSSWIISPSDPLITEFDSNAHTNVADLIREAREYADAAKSHADNATEIFDRRTGFSKKTIKKIAAGAVCGAVGAGAALATGGIGGIVGGACVLAADATIKDISCSVSTIATAECEYCHETDEGTECYDVIEKINVDFYTRLPSNCDLREIESTETCSDGISTSGWNIYDACAVKEYCDGDLAWYITVGSVWGQVTSAVSGLFGGERRSCRLHEYSSHWKAAMSNAASALEKAAEANRIVLNRIQKKIDNLDQMGADYETYYGGARAAWDNASLIASVVINQNKSGFNPRLTSYSSAYSDAYYIMTRMYEESVTAPYGPFFYISNMYPTEIQRLAGIYTADETNNSLVEGIKLYNILVKAEETMRQEYEDASYNASTAISELKDSVKQLEEEKLDLMKENPPTGMLSGYSGGLSEETTTVSLEGGSVNEKYENLKAEVKNIDKLYDSAQHLSENKGVDDYLAKAMEQMNNVTEQATAYRLSAEGLLEKAKGYRNAAQTAARNKISECESLIKSAEDTVRAAYAAQYLNSAKEHYPSDATTIGEQYVDYLAAYKDAEVCVEVMQGKENISIVSLDELLNRYLTVINCVEQAGYPDIAAQHRTLYNYYRNLNLTDRDVAVTGLEDEINSQIRSLYSMMENEFSDIYMLRAQISEMLNGMRGYGINVLSYQQRFDSYNTYFDGDKLNMERAICSLGEIRNGYNDLLMSLRSDAPGILSGIMGSEYQVSASFDETPQIDKEVGVDITVMLSNPTGIGSDQQVVVTIPFQYQVFKSDGQDLPSEVKDVVSDGSTLTITFYKVDPQTEYTLNFHVEGTFFRSSYREDYVTYSDELRTDHEVDVSFDADIPSDMVWDIESVDPWITTASATFDGRQTNLDIMPGSVKVYLPDVGKGSHTVVITYSVENRSASLNATRDAYYRELPDVQDMLNDLSETINTFRENGMDEEADLLQEQFDNATRLLNEAQELAAQGDWAGALDKLREAKETAAMDMNRLLDEKRQELMQRYAQLSQIWTRLGVEDGNVTALKQQIEEKLRLLNSGKLTADKLGVIKEVSDLLDQFEQKINYYLNKNVEKFMQELNAFKAEVNQFELNTVPKYREYYETLRNFKVGNTKLVVFPYTLTQLNDHIKEVKNVIKDVEKAGKNLTTQLVTTFRNAKPKFYTVRNNTLAVMENVKNRTENFISGSKKSISILEKRELRDEHKAKLDTLKKEVEESEQLLKQDKVPQAFMKSADAYTNLLMLISTLPPEENGIDVFQILIILLSVVFLGAIGYVVYTGLKKEGGDKGEGGILNLKLKHLAGSGKESKEQTVRRLRRSSIRRLARKKKP